MTNPENNGIQLFVSEVQKKHATGQATEHSYRPALETLFSSFGVTAINEPKQVKCGAPDFLISRDNIVIGHVEAKRPEISIQGMRGNNKSQQDRYREALPNLIYTNSLDWDFYWEGNLRHSVTIADLSDEIIPKQEQYDTLRNLLCDFVTQTPQTITSPSDLAKRMAGKANLIKDVLRNALADSETEETELAAQYQAFKENLIHDITTDDFADIYAETMAYGMFAARLHDTTLDSFSRQEALELLPRSNPFLRSLFNYIAGQDLDERIVWIIDDLASVFRACDVAKIMENFGNLTGQSDPFLHFYETFLAAYNPSKRKSRGVWYTPEPVVNFIVRAVDEVLQDEFGLPEGLADTSKITVDWDTGQTDRKGKPATIKRDLHRVQILDPATGTGTFLAETMKQIARRVHGVAPGMWSSYIEQDLIPRLHGLELLMASYAMCHMKLDMILTELDYKPTDNPPRLSVFLTNSLEEGEPANQTLPFAQWISREAKGANTIKRDMPIMCVIGNPPYLGEGGKSEGWIGDLMDDYKKEPGGKVKLQEQNPKWLNDLYVKFIRMSSHLIEKNGEGVLGFITNHGYLDNPTFRGMRWHLLSTFDRLWVLDLHGNTKKKEVTPEGKPDNNVFDIQQGVSIIIGVKTGQKDKGLAEVYRGDLWGMRQKKYAALLSSRTEELITDRIDCTAPQYAFVRRDCALAEVYEQGFALAEFMPINSVGLVTARDRLTIDFDKHRLWERVQAFARIDEEDARDRFNLGNDVSDWKVAWAQNDAKAHLTDENVKPITYRPFDKRWIFYTGRSRGFICRPRDKVMRHMLNDDNFGIATGRSNKNPTIDHYFISDSMMEAKCAERSTQSALFPLYLNPKDEHDVEQDRRVNFDSKLYKRMQKLATHPEHGTPDEVVVFDYIYGVLHCPAYRETYAEFLKVDFPRIPWPSSPDEFWDVSGKGTEMRKLHLMELQAIGPTPFPFMGDGNNVVDKPTFKDGKVWINKAQYFDNAPEVSWNLHIGGYQPAQKWLKDRKGRELNYGDVTHYQRILKILSETDRIMGTINMEMTKDLTLGQEEGET